MPRTACKMRLRGFLAGVAVVLALSAGGVSAGAAVGKVQSFELEQVRLLDGPFKTAQELNSKYLLSIDPDRMLHMFRVTAGLPSSAKPLGGWESPDCELRGHSMGHYISGLSLSYAATGSAEMKSRIDYLVTELAKVQEAMPSQGYSKGYLSAYPESLFDRVDRSEPVWAPWYTYHKIMAGLIDAHTYTGSTQALDVLKKMSAWVKFRTDRLTEQQLQSSLNMEFGGVAESLANLYAITGNPDDLKLARRFDKKWFTDALAVGTDRLTGLHANTHIPQVISSARLYELTGEKRYRDISTYFWDRIVPGRTYAIGGNSNYEHWRQDSGKLSTELTVESQESCCTYNMIKLAGHLFEWSADPRFADYCERAIYNGILSTIHPDNGMTMYYVALKPGHFKVFGTPENSFWCCTGTGMENHALYGKSIYFHDASSLYVNLFIPSVLDWKERGLNVRMDTRFPETAGVSLLFKAEKPVKLALKLRVPFWADEVTVKVNGRPQDVRPVPGSYIILERTWQMGDRVELHLPMSLRLEPTPDEPGTAAIMYGPLALAGELGTEKFSKDAQFVPNQRQQHSWPGVEVPVLVASKDASLADWIKPVAGKPMAWRTSGAGRPDDVSLIPFYRLFDQRYTVYWHLHTPESYKALEAQRKAIE